MATTNSNDGHATVTGRTPSGGYLHAMQGTSMGFDGTTGGSNWENTPSIGAAGFDRASASWAQGAGQPAPGCVSPAGAGGQAPSKLVVFGDLLSDNGNAAAVQKSLGQTPNYLSAPYDANGDFSDGPKWTTDLAHSLRLHQPAQQENFAYEGATGGGLGVTASPVNPSGGLTPLDTFAGQVQQFEHQDGAFSSSDVVSVTFGGNDIFLASAQALAGGEPATQVITDSANAIIQGLGRLADLGAKHFLVSNSPDVTLAPIFSSAEFLASGATVAGVQSLVSEFNTDLAAGLSAFQSSHAGLDVKTLDLHSLFNSIAANPSDYGFSNATQPVLSSVPGAAPMVAYNPAVNGQNPQVEHGSLFIDPLFDTTERGQMLIAQTAHNALMP